jgi:flagellar hook-length control protein FliK
MEIAAVLPLDLEAVFTPPGASGAAARADGSFATAFTSARRGSGAEAEPGDALPGAGNALPLALQWVDPLRAVVLAAAGPDAPVVGAVLGDLIAPFGQALAAGPGGDPGAGGGKPIAAGTTIGAFGSGTGSVSAAGAATAVTGSAQARERAVAAAAGSRAALEPLLETESAEAARTERGAGQGPASSGQGAVPSGAFAATLRGPLLELAGRREPAGSLTGQPAASLVLDAGEPSGAASSQHPSGGQPGFASAMTAAQAPDAGLAGLTTAPGNAEAARAAAALLEAHERGGGARGNGASAPATVEAATNAGAGIGAHNALAMPGAPAAAAPPAPPAIALDPGAAAAPEALAQRIHWLVDQKLGEARLKLHPPELGSLEIKISFVDDRAYVQMVAHHAAARDLLEQTLPRLREMLGLGGLDVGGASVSDGRGEAGGGFAPRTPAAVEPLQLESPAAASAGAPVAGPACGIDLYA